MFHEIHFSPLGLTLSAADDAAAAVLDFYVADFFSLSLSLSFSLPFVLCFALF